MKCVSMESLVDELSEVCRQENLVPCLMVEPSTK